MAFTCSLEQGMTTLNLSSPSHPRGVSPHAVVGSQTKSPIKFAPIPSAKSVCGHHRCLLSRLGRGSRQPTERQQQTVQGQWSMHQQTWHINYKELMVVFLTLQHFLDQVEHRQVLCLYQQLGGQGPRTCANCPSSCGTGAYSTR